MDLKLKSKDICAVTGANGYVGSRLAAALGKDFHVIPMGRKVSKEGIRWAIGDENLDVVLRSRAVKVLVHSAWDLKETNSSENWRRNVNGSAALVHDAKRAGVERVIFISSISAFEKARSDYGRSKLAVEKIVLGAGGTVIRPGLVWGNQPGGMFSAVSRQVQNGGLVPIIGDGRYPQYMVHEDDLCESVVRAARGEYAGRVLTIAHPDGCMFRDLVSGIALDAGKKVTLLQIPWPLIFWGLKIAEKTGHKTRFSV